MTVFTFMDSNGVHLTLLHSEQLKLYEVLAALSAIGLSEEKNFSIKSFSIKLK